MRFATGPIDGLVVKDLTKHTDRRGWLMELFREDDVPKEFFPAMSYVSSSGPGIIRGPHEHKEQADFFCFVGPSTFKISLWDYRKTSKTFGNRMILEAGESAPRSVVIPAGVVHAYKNIGATVGWVLNFPNRLYGGMNRKEPVDEIRHEDDPHPIFKLES
ncbi:MAG: dTDP-4-dehydrorhamnose 3,5-epimerase family protein [Bacteroidota bacterium]